MAVAGHLCLDLVSRLHLTLELRGLVDMETHFHPRGVLQDVVLSFNLEYIAFKRLRDGCHVGGICSPNQVDVRSAASTNRLSVVFMD